MLALSLSRILIRSLDTLKLKTAAKMMTMKIIMFGLILLISLSPGTTSNKVDDEGEIYDS